MKKALLLGAAGALVLAFAGVAAAQTASSRGGLSSGAYTALSPGNRSIVNALYDTQLRRPGTRRLTRDQIAAMKSSGKGWGEVFHDMQAAGLTRERNLGRAVSDYRLRVNAERHELRTLHRGEERHVDRDARFIDRDDHFVRRGDDHFVRGGDDHFVRGREGYRETHATRALSGTHQAGRFGHEAHGPVTTALGTTAVFRSGGAHGGRYGSHAHSASHIRASVTTAGGRTAGASSGAAGAAHMTTAAGERSGEFFHGGDFDHEPHGLMTTALGATAAFESGGVHGVRAGRHTRMESYVRTSVTTAGGGSGGAAAGAAGAAHVTTAAGGRSGEFFHGGGHGHGRDRD